MRVLPASLALFCALDSAAGAACTPDFKQADVLLQTMMGANALPGAGLWVFDSSGATIHQAFAGYNSETLLPVASAAKWVSAAVIMALVDDGTLRLDDKAGALLPYFTGDKAGMTLRQLISQTSGLDNQNDAPCLSDPTTTLDLCAREIAATVVMIGAPGRTFCYGANSMQVAARMAEAASGKSWNQLFNEKIRSPLGWLFSFYLGRQNPMIGSGLVSSMSEYAKFLYMVLNGGLYGATRVLSAGAIAEMRKDQSALAEFSCSPAPPYVHYGLGEWLDVSPGAPAGSQLSSPGYFGFYPWIDVKRKIAGIVEVHDVSGSASDNLRLVTHQVQQVVRERFDQAAAGADQDRDGIPDCRDNCPAAANVSQQDRDGDGIGDTCDCAPTNGRLWSIPDEADLLIFYPGGEFAEWQEALHPGGYVLDDRYDLIRSDTPANFASGTLCIGSNVAPQFDLIYRTESAEPSLPGRCFFYLVRAENNCGAGPAGYRSSGAVIPARECH